MAESNLNDLLYNVFKSLTKLRQEGLVASMARNDISMRYLSKCSAFRSYIMDKYLKTGITEVLVHKLFDENSGEELTPLPGYSFISESYDPEIKKRFRELQILRRAHNNITQDFILAMLQWLNDTESLCSMLKNWNALSKEVEKKANIFISYKERLEEIRANEEWCYNKKGAYYRKRDIFAFSNERLAIDNARRYYYDVTQAFFNYVYNREKSRGYLDVFYYSMYTAWFDVHDNTSATDIEEQQLCCKIWGVPYAPFPKKPPIVKTKKQNAASPSASTEQKPKAVEAAPSKQKEISSTKAKNEKKSESTKPVQKAKDSSPDPQPDTSAFEITKAKKLKKYLGTDEFVYIPSGVKSIGSYAFSKIKNKLKGVVIPEGVTELCEYAFYGCKKLEEVKLPSTLKTMDSFAFGECGKLNQIALPEGLTSLNCAFVNCTALESMDLPESLTVIGTRAFSGCVNLSSVRFGRRVTEIQQLAFENCQKLNSVTIPKNCKHSSFLDSFPKNCKINYF